MLKRLSKKIKQVTKVMKILTVSNTSSAQHPSISIAKKICQLHFVMLFLIKHGNITTYFDLFNIIKIMLQHYYITF